MAYLYFCECEGPTETNPLSVNESEDVMEALDLLCFWRQSLSVIEPPFGLELLSVWTPDVFGAVDRLNGDHYVCTFRNVDTVDHFASCGLDGL